MTAAGVTAAGVTAGTVTLASGTARLVVAPAIGGAILGFWWEVEGRRRDWLAAARVPPIAEFSGSRIASFPLVPWSNRIRDGRFTFAGRTVVDDAAAHAIHGHGWKRGWRIAAAGADHLAIAYEHAPAAWPWAYRAEQHFRLNAAALTVETRLTNLSAEPMPAGLGHHPYFPRTARTSVTAAVGSMWIDEAGKFPVTRGTPPPDRDPRRGIAVDRSVLDHAFPGWSGAAVIDWPEDGARLALSADPTLDTLVIYAPPGSDVFCVEPVSHSIDAFNRAAAGDAGTGMRILAPGEAWTSWMRLEPQLS